MAKIFVGIPGPSANWGAIRGLICASRNHEVLYDNSNNAHDNFNGLWTMALNGYEKGYFTHFIMLHSDVTPHDWWVDTLYDEMEKAKVSLLSVAVAIKDDRGVLSCGIGNRKSPWNPWRRLTIKELEKLPDTFGAAEMGYPGGQILHNNACWIADLRDEKFFSVGPDGGLVAYFDFPKRVQRHPDTKEWIRMGESEDWYFSRRLDDLKIPTAITKAVELNHKGSMDFPNRGTWGRYEQDEDTKFWWGRDEKPEEKVA
jgi:hypothetical protein